MGHGEALSEVQHLGTSLSWTVSASIGILTKSCSGSHRVSAGALVSCAARNHCASCNRAPESVHGMVAFSHRRALADEAVRAAADLGRGCSSWVPLAQHGLRDLGAWMCMLLTEVILNPYGAPCVSKAAINPGNVHAKAGQGARVACCRSWVSACRQSNMQMYRAETVLPLVAQLFAKCRPCAGMPWRR
ncbi:hypothetical protein B0H11DRAFT_2052864 [Mycena galericulata]|nr:hypothetical protein B0H11DRAFT_2052864 [Mycena galericulata]